MALPELDGALEPIVFAGRDSNTGKSHSLPVRPACLPHCGDGWSILASLLVAERMLRAFTPHTACSI